MNQALTALVFKNNRYAMKTIDMVLCSIFAAVMCVFSMITIPIGAVSITLAVFGVMLIALTLGTKRAVITIALFILIGAIGLPVFSGFKGGISVLFGPTGGYITSYIFIALIVGLLTKKLPANKTAAFIIKFLACLAGLLVCYALGTVQFVFLQSVNITQALWLCVIPFIPFDIIKIIFAITLSDAIKRTTINRYFDK